MRTNVAPTSLDAYRSLSASDYLQPKERQVLAAFRPGLRLTRKEIAEAAGMPLSCVCGRVYILIAKGALKSDGTKLDPGTQRHAEALKLAAKQLEIA